MNRLETNSRSHRRRGATLTSYAIVSAFVLIGFAVAAIDLSLVSNRRDELQTACDAAALAACGELLDSAPLSMQKSQNKAASLTVDQRKSGLIERARKVGVDIASQNSLKIDENRENDPQGELVVGWVADSADPTESMIAWRGGTLVNSVRVSAGEQSDHRITMRIGQMLGLANAKIFASARATLEQRVYGFEPAGDVPVPMLPIVVDQASWRVAESDLFRYDPTQKRFRAEANGISEYLLTFGEKQAEREKPANAWVTSIGPDSDLIRQIKSGLNLKDIEYTGGKVALGLRLPISPSSRETIGPLHSIKGQVRIIAVGSSQEQLVTITSFAAARVVDAQVNADRACLLIEPCTMTTPTALVDAEASENEYIGKLMLTQ